MLIQFSEAELCNVTIQPVEHRKISSVYQDEREIVWTAQMEKVLARGGKLWNGEIYTLEDVLSPVEGQIILKMSTCEYKDLMFLAIKGPEHISGQFGEAHQFHFTGVSCVPMTRDGKYVFGIRADRDVPMLGGIGGNLNKDEMEIHFFDDIRGCMLREIQEETALECQNDDLRFFGLHVSGGLYLFLFTVALPIHSEDVNHYHRSGEFSSLVALTLKEALSTPIPATWAYRRWRPYFHLLPSR
jgi:8-oxo-dGTP pyrophosphatase MutT (NUDIX family)